MVDYKRALTYSTQVFFETLSNVVECGDWSLHKNNHNLHLKMWHGARQNFDAIYFVQVIYVYDNMVFVCGLRGLSRDFHANSRYNYVSIATKWLPNTSCRILCFMLPWRPPTKGVVVMETTWLVGGSTQIEATNKLQLNWTPPPRWGQN